jgi:UDP-N-acetylglucosamine 2-epimerase (non-hydrolysing)
MTLFDAADTGRSPHTVLLLAGTRPEAARLAPVASALAGAGRIVGITVATGPDPILVHEALEALGRPPDITLLLVERPRGEVALAAALAVRIDQLLDEMHPSAVLVTGGGICAVMAAQVAFWRQIPVVYLEPGFQAREQLCPFPDGGNRRVVGQLTSLFLRVSDEPSPAVPDGPNAITVGDTLTGTADTPTARDDADGGVGKPLDVALNDPALAELVTRARAGTTRIVLLDAAARSLVEVSGPLLEAHPDVEIVFLGARRAPLRDQPRARALAHCGLSDLVGLLLVSTLAATDRSSACRESVDFGLPTLLVDDAYWIEPGAERNPTVDRRVVTAERGSALAALTRLLAAYPSGAARWPDLAASARAEHALAWMFGLEPEPEPVGAGPSTTAIAPSIED